MVSKLSSSSDPIDRYIFEHSIRLTDEQNEIIQYTSTLPGRLPHMLGSVDEAQFFQLIIQSMECKRCIEIGTFTGYTALAIASVLPSDGHLFTCDIDDQYIRKDIWKKTGVDEKITVKLGPAVDSLKTLLEENGPGSFDFIFIDADKVNYLEYYQLAVELVRVNGLIAIDNTLWGGKVIDETNTIADSVTSCEKHNIITTSTRQYESSSPVILPGAISAPGFNTSAGTIDDDSIVITLHVNISLWKYTTNTVVVRTNETNTNLASSTFGGPVVFGYWYDLVIAI
ncbi:unnamed protein product [Adineta ricciae]|uniref:Uncharacterized protein n=1 Tax=Adineta ricciae TaxID=249248 RepID=A0A813T0E8_ADIRI|nr:unnamed protein product [Adineta ricciae]